MFKPIKFPLGPSASGAAGVRALDRVGGDWQRKEGPGSTSKLMGDFRRVTIEDVPQYFCAGAVNNGTVRTFATRLYQLPFAPWTNEVPGTALGATKYAGPYSQLVQKPFATYTYDVGEASVFEREVTQDVRGGFYRAPPKPIGGFIGGYYRRGDPSFSSFQTYYAARTDEEVPRQQIVTPMTIKGDRVDYAGRPLFDPAIFVVYPDGFGGTVQIDPGSFTYPDVEMYERMPFLYMKNYSLMFMGEMFFQPRYVGEDEFYEPHLWLGFFEGNNFEEMSLVDMTSTMMVDTARPARSFASGPPVQYFYLATAGNGWNTAASNALAFMECVALPDNTALIFYSVPVQNTPPGSFLFVMASRILRISFPGGVFTAELVREVRSTPALSFLDAQTIKSAVHLGGGRVLCKVMASVPAFAVSTPRDIQFMRSDDGGDTWELFEPTGFDAELKNRFFGNFVVHRPADASRAPDDQEATVLIPAWNPNDNTYRVYESKDSGATWTRKGVIYKSAVFRRIDSFVAGDGGGNFETLLPGPSYSAPVDPTLPDRYS